MSWNSPQFVVGEVVALRSTKHGAAMTIESVDQDKIQCVWVDKQGKVRRDAFPKACLKTSSDADAHIIFMPSDMLDIGGQAEFLAGNYQPGSEH